MLVIVLLLLALFLTLGAALLSVRVGERRALVGSRQAAQARALARSGLEDARLKLGSDQNFPGPLEVGQTRFVYAESWPEGSYEVTLDYTYAAVPYEVLRVVSVGRSGEASARSEAWLQVNESDPDRPWRWVRWTER